MPKIESIPSASVQQALRQTINDRYPELTANSPAINYSKRAGVWHASVTFYSLDSSASAYFKYVQTQSGEFYWYCNQDWND